MSKTVLITGATGQQGGSVIDHLLGQDDDLEILALTRDVTSPGAQRLAAKSPKIKLVQGNLDQPEDIFVNWQKVTSQSIWGVFSVQVPAFGGSRDIEERQGKGLVDAALKNHVKLFVHTSVDRGGDASLENPTNIPHFISKHYIEQHLIDSSKNTEMAWTILRPVAFMDNLTPDFVGKVFTTTWKIALKGKPLQLIAVTDIGFFGAQAFLHPAEYKGKCISLAGDDLTFDDMAKIFKSKTGKDVPLTFDFVVRLFMWLVNDFGYMFRWFHDEGYKADIAALRKVHPGLKDLSTWLETESVFIDNK
ncbi:hypothetical protein ARAM_002494 [Aspergillus rambellii]|uniref:NmrA-like domain-containing protein n=1 Tax=Aspergillus rambellii TaxID=308745 RepID=A0A0F8UR54_9EURO|nr:hypothetical protein ARAM_002494 [Aspergillus rambellii]